MAWTGWTRYNPIIVRDAEGPDLKHTNHFRLLNFQPLICLCNVSVLELEPCLAFSELVLVLNWSLVSSCSLHMVDLWSHEDFCYKIFYWQFTIVSVLKWKPVHSCWTQFFRPLIVPVLKWRLTASYWKQNYNNNSFGPPEAQIYSFSVFWPKCIELISFNLSIFYTRIL